MAYINGINIDDNLINQYKKVMGNSQTTKTNKKTSVAPQGSNVNNVIADAMKQNGLQESTKDVREALGDVGEDLTKRLSQTKIVKALSNTLNNVSDKNTDALNKTKDLTKGIGYEFANSTDGKVKGFGLANNNLQESKNWLKQYNNNKDFQDSLYYDFAVNQSNLYEDYKGAMKSLEKMDKDTKANYEYYLNESAKNNDLDTYKELIASINNKDNSALEKLGRGVVSGIQEAVSSPMNVVSGAVGGLAEASTGRGNLLTENVRNYQKELNLTKQGFQDENQVLNTLYNGVNGATKTLSLLALDPTHSLTWQVGDSAVAKYNEYIDKGVDPNRAYAGLVMNMAMSYGINKTGMDKLIARLGGGEIDATMDLAYQTLGSRILKGMGSQFLEEGGEGLVEYFLEQQLDNAIANTDVDYKLGDAMLSFVQEGFGGLITGGVTEFAGFNIRSINAQKQAMSDINYLNYLLSDNSIPKSENDIKLINDRINKLEQAIDTYKGQSVLGQAVEFIDDKDATFNRYIADKQFKQDSLSANQELDTKNLAMEQAVVETELEDKFNQNNEDIAKVQAIDDEINNINPEFENPEDAQEYIQDNNLEEKQLQQKVNESMTMDEAKDLDNSNTFDEEAKTNLSDFLDLPIDDLSAYFQSNAKSADAQIESMKKKASKHPEKWIPNYAQIKNRFAGLSSQTIGRATFEIINDGKISDETSRDLNKEFKDWIKKDIKDVEIKDSMYLDTEQFVNDFAEVCQEYFETNDLYESNKKQDSKIAKESLKYLRVGEESPIAYEDGKKYLERNAQSEVNREQLRQTSFEWLTDWFNSLHASQEGAKNQMRDLKKIKVGRNIDQVLKYMSNHNGKILDNLRNTFGKQWNDARTRQAEFKRVYGGLLQEIVNSGITEDSELSKYVQYIMEGHTEEILEVQGNDGNNVKERKKFTTKDLQKLVNDGKISQDDYQKVIDTAIKLRSAYDDIFDLINTQRRDIYGNLEEEVRNELIKQEVKVDEAYKVLKKLENELLSKPTEQLQAQFDQAKKQYNREYNVYEKLLDKNISKDDVRRQLLQYRQNYSHHIYKGNFIEDIKGISTPKNGVPTELVGLSDYTTPLSEFGTFFLKQNELGKYTPDAIASFNDYIKQASEIYGLDPYITFARTFANELGRMAVGDDSHAFKNFKGWLTNHANLCAGKTDTDTRSMREWLGENNTKTLLKFLSKIRYNQLAYNNRTAVTQLLNIPNGIATIENEGGSTKNFLNGFIQYQKDAKYSFGSKSNKGTLSSQSSFLTNRYWDVDTGKTGFKNFMSEVADTMMSMGDQIGTEFLWYSAYDLGKQKGYSGQELIDFADRLTENSVAGRGKGEVPLTMSSGFTKAFLPFQIETNNAWTQMRDELSDVFKGENAKVKATAMKSMTALLIFNYLMNGLTDWLFGDRVLFDPIDTLLEDEDADTKATHLVGEIISANPYGSVFLNALGLASDDTKKIFGDHSANRYGTGVAGLSQVGNIIKASGKDAKANALSKEIVKTTIPGGTQLVRTLEGGQSVGVIPYFEDGQLVYKTAELTADGKVKFDNANADSVDVIKALAFGKWATTEARAYIDSNFATIGAKKYDALKDVMSTKDMRELNSQFVSENKKDENGDSISNSKALNNRKVLEDNGLWNELSQKYTSKELSDIFGLNQKVADMSSKEFNAEYQKVWGDKENTKVVKEQNKSAIDFESFYKNFFSKKEDTKVENTKVEETKEETEEVKDYTILNSDYDKNHKGELTNHYNEIAKDYDDEKKYILKQSSQFNAIYDDNGNTIKNSKALQVRNYLQENGMYADVVNYIKENNLKASDFGLNNKVFAMSDETFQQAYSMLEQGKAYTTSSSSSSSSSTKKTAEQKAYETAMKKFKTYSLNQAKSYASAMTPSSNTSSRLNMSVDDIRKEIEKLYK